MAGVDQVDAEAAGFEDFKGGDPVDAGGFQRHRIHAAGYQPIGQGVQVRGEGGEAAYRLTIAVWGNGGPDFVGADVEAGGVGVDAAQGFETIIFRTHLTPP